MLLEHKKCEIVSTSCTRSHIATTKQKIIIKNTKKLSTEIILRCTPWSGQAIRNQLHADNLDTFWTSYGDGWVHLVQFSSTDFQKLILVVHKVTNIALCRNARGGGGGGGGGGG